MTCYVDFNFRWLSVSVTRFLAVFDHIQIWKISYSSTYHLNYMKENIITNLQKLYSQPRNLMARNKSPAIFLIKPLCMGDLSPLIPPPSPHAKYSLKDMCIIFIWILNKLQKYNQKLLPSAKIDEDCAYYWDCCFSK